MLNRFTTPLVAMGLLMAAPTVQAQEPGDYPAGAGYGAPAQGVEVPTRVNVGDSQRVLQVTQQPSQPQIRVVGDVNALPPEVQSALGVAGGANAANAEGTRVNDNVTGLDVGRQYVEEGWIENADAYRGVIPGDRDSLPHLARTQRHGESGNANTLSWVGFQPLEGVTRVFLQTGRPAQFREALGPDGLSLTISLSNTQVELSNFRRPIDAAYFERAVRRVETFRRGDGTTDVVIQLSRAATYTVQRAGEYLYIDFAE